MVALLSSCSCAEGELDRRNVSWTAREESGWNAVDCLDGEDKRLDACKAELQLSRTSRISLIKERKRLHGIQVQNRYEKEQNR